MTTISSGLGAPPDLADDVVASGTPVPTRMSSTAVSVSGVPPRSSRSARAAASRSIIIMGWRFAQPSEALCRARVFRGREDM